MSVRVNWFDEAQTILLISGTKFTSADLSAAKPEITRLQQSVQYPIGIIQDMRQLTMFEPSNPARPVAITGMSLISDSAESSTGRVVAITYVYRADMVEEMNRMYNQILTLMESMMPESGGISMRAFSSVGAAADFISDVLKQGQ